MHHDNFSSHATLDQLKGTVDFIVAYAQTINQYRINNQEIHINLTGGEPTNNPNFLELAEYLKQSKANLNLFLTLTTNGTVGKRAADIIGDTFNYITVSYHAEADSTLKQNVLDRIDQLHQKTTVKVNVMFHADYFDECIDVCEQLKQKSINYIPRIIGEAPGVEKNYGHTYSEEQLAWFNNFWGVDQTSTSGYGAELGRPCCGGRKMKISNDAGEQEVKFLTYRKFQNWYCSVNWYFIHIEQQTGSVYHHQTCQAKFDQTTGPIGKISEGNKIVSELKTNLENKTMPVIVCPNTFCSCGLCTPKSTSKDKLLSVLNGIIDTSVFS
jgi:organic radical activating enzyme